MLQSTPVNPGSHTQIVKPKAFCPQFPWTEQEHDISTARFVPPKPGGQQPVDKRTDAPNAKKVKKTKKPKKTKKTQKPTVAVRVPRNSLSYKSGNNTIWLIG